jgi:hypothetical protein
MTTSVRTKGVGIIQEALFEIENKGSALNQTSFPLIPYQNSSYIDVELHF